MREEVERLWMEMGVQAKVEGIREVNKRKKGERRMVVVKLRDREGKKEVMRKKKLLKGKRERIEDDWTMKERLVQWRLEEITRMEQRRNKRAEMRYTKIWMEGKWWSWNEDRKRLVDGSGIEWENKELIGFGGGKKIIEGGEVKIMETGK